MEEAKIDRTYCLKECNKNCWRKASNYIFKDKLYSFTNECIENLQINAKTSQNI